MQLFRNFLCFFLFFKLRLPNLDRFFTLLRVLIQVNLVNYPLAIGDCFLDVEHWTEKEVRVLGEGIFFMNLGEVFKQMFAKGYVFCFKQFCVTLSVLFNERKSSLEQLNIVVKTSWEFMLIRKLFCLFFKFTNNFFNSIIILIFNCFCMEVSKLFSHFSKQTILESFKFAQTQNLRMTCLWPSNEIEHVSFFFFRNLTLSNIFENFAKSVTHLTVVGKFTHSLDDHLIETIFVKQSP